jgi:hypothetical protein
VHGFSGGGRSSAWSGHARSRDTEAASTSGCRTTGAAVSNGSHCTSIWRQGASRYAASLHSWRPHRQTLAVLAAIVDHLATQPGTQQRARGPVARAPRASIGR